MVKYNLGGIGNREDSEYININLSGNSHIKADILDLDSFCEDNSVDEFFMSHTYEHISPVNIKEFLSNILRKLKTGGIFRVVHTDVKGALELYKRDEIDFRGLRDIIFPAVDRRMKTYEETGRDLMAHHYMWGVEELVEELIFYGFRDAKEYNAGHWKFDFKNYLPGDNMGKYQGVLIPNLGVIGIK